MITYDRYSQFRSGSEIDMVPFGKIKKKNTDQYEVYMKNQSRLDLISFKYYDNPNYGWLILQANPEAGSMEYEIPDKTLLRIPYPLSVSIQDYRDSIDEYYRLYGNDERD
jgi:hypothetical protein